MNLGVYKSIEKWYYNPTINEGNILWYINQKISHS